MDYARELEVALEAAAQASAYLKQAYADFTPIPDAPASISTEADKRSQDIILARLRAVFPDDAVAAEEGTASLREALHSAPRTWVVDPIDGTLGFVKKNGEFSVMIGLVAKGRVVVGVVAEPALDRVTYARFGHGCWVRVGNKMPDACFVTKTEKLAEASLVQSHSKGGRTSWPVDVLKPAKVVETYSAGVKMAMVARGEVDLYVNTYSNFSDWDICAGDVLITEAGGACSEIAGSPITYLKPGNSQQGGLLATNGRVHAAAVAGLQRKPTKE